MPQGIDITGKRSGMLTAIRRVGKNSKGYLWLCKCDCGNECIVPTFKINGQLKKSCGCNQVHRTHGKSKERLYRIFIGMIYRCENPNMKFYKDYGGRGIKVCEKWRHNYLEFRQWAYENGYDETAPKMQCTIDRIDVNGDYEPSNCRWVGSKIQHNNTRNVRKITINGVTKTIPEWCEENKINPKTVYGRIHLGWEPEKAVSEPVVHPRTKTCITDSKNSQSEAGTGRKGHGSGSTEERHEQDFEDSGKGL